MFVRTYREAKPKKMKMKGDLDVVYITYIWDVVLIGETRLRYQVLQLYFFVLVLHL